MAITSIKPVREARYRRLALGNSHLELHHGQLWEKPGMSVKHGDVMVPLVAWLHNQLDRNDYRVRVQHARLRVSAETYYVPDIAVIPSGIVRALLEHPLTLDAYSDPVPLVIEIWSPSTGDFDITAKLPDYQARGDREIWFIPLPPPSPHRGEGSVHPYERILTAWRRRADGGYDVTVYRGGMVYPASLPGVVIDLDALFAP